MKIGFIKNSIKTQQQIREKSEEIKNSSSTSDVKESSQYSISSKTDSTQLKGSASFGDKRIAMAKSAMLYEASQDTSAARLADIKARIESGTYHVDSHDIAKSILEA